MQFLKKYFLKSISFAVYPQLDENKKIAIQIASFDAIASVVAMMFYFFYAFESKSFPISFIHLAAVALCVYGMWLLKKRHYNAGRVLIFYVGLLETFICLDGVGPNSGFEFYYFPPLIVPFVVFTPEEVKKSIFLSMSGLALYIFQQFIGIGHFSVIQEATSSDRIITIGILFTYVFGLFSVSRWQMNLAQKKIKSQQSELIHISNIAALGEMSGGVAHEINNPLQILSTQLNILNKDLKELDNTPEKIFEHTLKMENTISRISRLVKGLKNLSRNVSSDPASLFPVSLAIDDMLAVSSQKLKFMDITLNVSGNTALKVKGHMVQLSQVLINLLNNSVDAINDSLEDKWINLEVIKSNQKIVIMMTDSGPGIPKDVASKIMQPFFTTKAPGSGTGLGLSISSRMIEKMEGKLYLDQNSSNTRFVIELPVPNLETEPAG